MQKKKGNFFTPAILLLVIAVLGYYTYISNHSRTQQEIPKKSDKEKLIEYNIAENYPRTVRETVNLYCKFSKLAYSGTCTDEELYALNLRMRELFDNELLEINSADQQLKGLKNDIALYTEKKQKFVSYTLEEASMIQYNTENNIEYAKTKATYNITVGMASVPIDQEFLLRKDDTGKWKILGWQSVQPKKEEGVEQ